MKKEMVGVNPPHLNNIAIICKDYMTVRKCLRGLDWAAEKYYLKHDFKTPVRGINVGNVRFTILSSRSLLSHLLATHWDLFYLDVGIDKDICSKIITLSSASMQEIAYLDFSLYNIELVMDNIVKFQCGVNLDNMTLSAPVEVESEYRRICIGED